MSGKSRQNRHFFTITEQKLNYQSEFIIHENLNPCQKAFRKAFSPCPERSRGDRGRLRGGAFYTNISSYMSNLDFPILRRKINGKPLIYLDNASTAQKPRRVIEAISDFYKFNNANIHRGIHTLSQEATKMYEAGRDKVQKFINAGSREEIIFTSGATEAINLVVWTWGHENIRRRDEILLTEMEHHSNIVPWQMLAKKKQVKIKYAPIAPDGRLKLSAFISLITHKTKILSLTHISNVLGTINPIEKIIKIAHSRGAKVLIDGAQAGGHIKIDVQKLNADFYVLSGHKMYGPTGVGVLYGKKDLLMEMPPYQTGGHMIKRVTFEEATWNDLPWKFEAGTANIAEVIGLGAAIEFLNSPSLTLPTRGRERKKITKFPSLDGRGKGRVIETIEQYEQKLTAYSLRLLSQIPGLTIYGPRDAKDRIGVISFNLKNIPPHDLASILDEQGIAIRTGHHCAMPLHQKLGIESSARVSLAIYNTKGDIDRLIDGLNHARRLLSPPL